MVIIMNVKNNNIIVKNKNASRNYHLTDKYQAGTILNHVASQIGGKGGGRADMAQGGGTEPEKLTDALSSVKDLIG